MDFSANAVVEKPAFTIAEQIEFIEAEIRLKEKFLDIAETTTETEKAEGELALMREVLETLRGWKLLLMVSFESEDLKFEESQCSKN